MTRGRRLSEAIRLATLIAEKRDEVRHIRHGPGLICNFVIYCAGSLAHVRIKRMRHLRCTLAWLEREAAEELAALHIIASSPAIARELWICSRRGNFRIFRVCDNGVVELDRDGQPLPVQLSFIRRRTRTGAGKTGTVPEKAEPASAPAVLVVTPLLSSVMEPAPATSLSVGEQPPSEPGGGKTHDL
jgi:hypothetical protein